MINYPKKRAIARGWKCNRCGSQDLRERLKTFLECMTCGFSNSKNAMSLKNKRHTYYKEEA